MIRVRTGQRQHRASICQHHDLGVDLNPSNRRGSMFESLGQETARATRRIENVAEFSAFGHASRGVVNNRGRSEELTQFFPVKKILDDRLKRPTKSIVIRIVNNSLVHELNQIVRQLAVLNRVKIRHILGNILDRIGRLAVFFRDKKSVANSLIPVSFRTIVERCLNHPRKRMNIFLNCELELDLDVIQLVILLVNDIGILAFKFAKNNDRRDAIKRLKSSLPALAQQIANLPQRAFQIGHLGRFARRRTG